MTFHSPPSLPWFSQQERTDLRRLSPAHARDCIRAMCAEAAELSGVKVSLIMGDCRFARVVRARDMVIAKAAAEGFIDEIIAEALGMDRSSIYTARQREAKRRGEA